MFEINIQSDMVKVMKGFSKLDRDSINRAAANAINRSISAGKTTAIKEIMKLYNIDKKYLSDKRSKTNFYSAITLWRSNKYSLTGKIRAFGNALPIICFPVTQTATGISIQVKKGSSSTIKEAFLSQRKKGDVGIFARGKYNKGVFQPRFHRVKPPDQPDTPITKLTTTSVRAMVSQPAVLKAIAQKAEQTFPNRFKHELTWLVTR